MGHHANSTSFVKGHRLNDERKRNENGQYMPKSSRWAKPIDPKIPIVDEEFKELLRTLTEDEYKGLEADIVNHGIKDPIAVWSEENIVIDGHHRLAIAQSQNPPLPYEIKTMSFENRTEAKIWILENQKGRRNLNTLEMTVIIGMDYDLHKMRDEEKAKIAVAAMNAAKQDDSLRGQIDPIEDTSHKTAKEVGEKFGVTEKTVRRASEYKAGIDAIKAENPDRANDILGKKEFAAKENIRAIGKMAEESKKECVEAIAKGDYVDVTVRRYRGTKEPTHEEKIIAKQHNIPVESVQFAKEYDIPVERMRTHEQLEEDERNANHACGNIWDGLYKCTCSKKFRFETFFSDIRPTTCPNCGQIGNITEA
jgi:ParB-like chromosome segregation protein Spo0J